MLFAVALTGCNNTFGGYEEGTKLTVIPNQSSLRTGSFQAVVVDPIKEEKMTKEEVEDLPRPITVRMTKGKMFKTGLAIGNDDTIYSVSEEEVYHDANKAVDITNARQSMFYKSSSFNRLLAANGSANDPYDYSNFNIPSLIALSNKADTPDWTQFLMYVQAYQTFKDSVGDLTPKNLSSEDAQKYLTAINTFKTTATPIMTNLAKDIIRFHQYYLDFEKTPLIFRVNSVAKIQKIHDTLYQISNEININPVSVNDSLNVKQALYALPISLMNAVDQLFKDIPEINAKAVLDRMQERRDYQVDSWAIYQAKADAIKEKMKYTEAFKAHTNTSWKLLMPQGQIYTLDFHEFNPETGLISTTVSETNGTHYEGLITKFISDKIITVTSSSNIILNLIFDDKFETLSGQFGDYGATFSGTIQSNVTQVEPAPAS